MEEVVEDGVEKTDLCCDSCSYFYSCSYRLPNQSPRKKSDILPGPRETDIEIAGRNDESNGARERGIDGDVSGPGRR